MQLNQRRDLGVGHAWKGLAAAAILSGMLSACASTSDNSSPSPAARFFGGPAATPASEDDIPSEYFLKAGYCPPVQIRPGTESLTVYDRGHEGEAAFVRSQGSVARTARECDTRVPGTLAMKVGVAGRVVAGPRGGAGTVTMPLRIAVVKQNGGNVLYSQAFKVTVTIAPPEFGSDFSQVIDPIVVPVGPEDRDLIVYVGFDGGDPRTAGATG